MDGTALAALDVFLSHAKQDGRMIAEGLRDGMRRFGQLVPWYDANDLRLDQSGDTYEACGKERNAAMIATFTDAYPTRRWCRRRVNIGAHTRESN